MKETRKEELSILSGNSPPSPPPQKKKIIPKIVFLSLVVKTWKEGSLKARGFVKEDEKINFVLSCPGLIYLRVL